jgi:hypothetical protein
MSGDDRPKAADAQQAPNGRRSRALHYEAMARGAFPRRERLR